MFKEQNVVITDHKRDCISRNCKLCGSVRFQKSIQLWNEGMDWNKTFTWHQREYVHKDDTKSKKMKRNILIKLGTQVLWYNCLHYLRGPCTIIQFIYSTFDGKPYSLKNAKKQLNVGDVMMIMDFAQNWTHHRQDEIQGDIGPKNKAHCTQL